MSENIQTRMKFYPNGNWQEIAGTEAFVREMLTSQLGSGSRLKEGKVTEWLKRIKYEKQILIAIIALGAFLISCFVFISGNTSSFDWVKEEYFKIIYWTLASLWSGFLATYALIIHGPWSNIQKPEENIIGYKNLRWSIRIHQHTLNLAGALVGWFIFYLFIQESWLLRDLEGWEKIILLVLGFISVTGYLPYTLIVKNWLPGK